MAYQTDDHSKLMPVVLSIVFFFIATFGWAKQSFSQALNSMGEPILYGVKHVPRGLDVCFDYLAQPYRIVDGDRVITKHEGIDFCAPSGTPVLAPISGRIQWVLKDNELFGGGLMIDPGVRVRLQQDKRAKSISLMILHMVPERGIRAGTKVKAGQVIGSVQAANRPEIGRRPHLHMVVKYCEDRSCHVDPNLFWRDGVGRVSCFKKNQPAARGQITAPMPC
ncbi:MULTISPECIES: M23 family metallopeptidase [unclassified Ruegeria]|uniref:M23 family metallopeptidase n=1 Tax=unclassified Ruegeria TaxID=2625375 RepID=UPI0014884E58|nr:MULTISPECIES: peptidoglycan DD-metalloendopeptidase family protein [unclassified Ruegeria]NOD62139.1 peptidoglycan DD-metalloendopeptidase family protein [Ruegeria sp. HKCCD6109]